MSITYEITTVEDPNTAGRLNVRDAPNGKRIIGKFIRGRDHPVGEGQTSGGWIKINSPIAGWCSGSYLSPQPAPVVEVKPVDTPPAPAPEANTEVEDESENMNGVWASGRTITGKKDKDYRILYERYIRSFGCPPQFTEQVDIPYTDSITKGVGRVFAKSLFSNPSLLSICPGDVDYLPGFSKQTKSEFLRQVKGLAHGHSLRQRITKNEKDPFTSGKLFEFKQDFAGYIKKVNVLARTMSLFLGIGNEKMPGTSITLKKYDYGWWFSRKGSKIDSNDSSIFGQAFAGFNQMKGAAVGDDAYIHYFIMGQGSSLSEDMSTQTEASNLEQMINGSELDSMQRNISFLFGGNATGKALDEDGPMSKDIDAVLSGAPGILQSIGFVAKNYLKGGRMVFPQMISGVNYSKSMSCTIRCVSPSGSKLGFFLGCGVPICFSLALGLPKQMADNMYSYPHILRCFQQGRYNSELCVMGNLRITRGGQDDMAWTIDSLPTEVEIGFDILPLYSEMMVTSSDNPFLYMKNTSMLEYLGSLCGVDLKLNNLPAKVEIAGAMLKNRFSDIPTNLGRGVTEHIMTSGLVKKVLHGFQLMR